MRVYNLEGIRNTVFEQMDWAPSQSTVAKKRVNEFIDRATTQLCLEAPALFNEDEVRLAVHKDQVPTLTTDTLSVVSGDTWVLQTDLAVGTTDAVVWEEDREWSGRYLLLRESGGTDWHLVRIREVWSNVVVTTTYKRISLETPWGGSLTATDIEYRVVSNEFVLPDDVVEIRNLSLMESASGYPYPLHIIGQSPAEAATFPNSATLQSSGVPRVAYRRERQYIDGPTRAPGVEIIADNVTWVGPEATGTFEYLITYGWGRQERWSTSPGPRNQDDVQQSRARYEPYWESAPSPVSSVATVASASNVVVLHLPNLDHMLGFDDAGTPRYQHTGLVKRIYRRRVTATAAAVETPGAGVGILAYPHQDATDRFYFFDEVDSSTTEYTDDGAVIPDWNRPFREVHGYQTFRLYPTPDARYELVIRYIRRPLPLQDDSDVPQVPRDAIEAIILRAMVYGYEMQGNAAMAQRKLAEYERSVGYLLKRYGDLRPPSRQRRRRVARVRNRSLWRREVSGVVTNS